MHAPGFMNVKIVRFSLNPKKGIAVCIVLMEQFLVLQYKKLVAVHQAVANNYLGSIWFDNTIISCTRAPQTVGLFLSLNTCEWASTSHLYLSPGLHDRGFFVVSIHILRNP